MARYSIPQAYDLQEIEADPAAVIDQVREAHPDLHWGGIGLNGIDLESGVAREARHKAKLAKLVTERARMTSESAVQQFLRACRYIDATPRTVTPDWSHGTYGWKHQAERYGQMQGWQQVYVPEGMFITAAIAMGLAVVKPMGSYCSVNLSAEAWKTTADSWATS